MADIYLPFLFAHYGLYGNAPVHRGSNVRERSLEAADLEGCWKFDQALLLRATEVVLADAPNMDGASYRMCSQPR